MRKTGSSLRGACGCPAGAVGASLLSSYARGPPPCAAVAIARSACLGMSQAQTHETTGKCLSVLVNQCHLLDAGCRRIQIH